MKKRRIWRWQSQVLSSVTKLTCLLVTKNVWNAHNL
jgi:hypothetical protein